MKKFVLCLVAFLLVNLNGSIKAEETEEIFIRNYELLDFGSSAMESFIWDSSSRVPTTERLQFLSGYRIPVFEISRSVCFPKSPLTKSKKKAFFECLAEFCYVGSNEDLDKILTEIYSKKKYEYLRISHVFDAIVKAQGPVTFQDKVGSMGYTGEIDYAILYKNLDEMVASYGK